MHTTNNTGQQQQQQHIPPPPTTPKHHEHFCLVLTIRKRRARCRVAGVSGRCSGVFFPAPTFLADGAGAGAVAAAAGGSFLGRLVPAGASVGLVPVEYSPGLGVRLTPAWKRREKKRKENQIKITLKMRYHRQTDAKKQTKHTTNKEDVYKVLLRVTIRGKTKEDVQKQKKWSRGGTRREDKKKKVQELEKYYTRI